MNSPNHAAYPSTKRMKTTITNQKRLRKLELRIFLSLVATTRSSEFEFLYRKNLIHTPVHLIHRFDKHF